MKKIKIECNQIRYAEFPELKFGISEDGDAYCDISHYLDEKELSSTHDIFKFQQKFFYFLTKAQLAYQLDPETIISENSEDGHYLLISELALLFIMYTDPNFMFYALDRIDEMFTSGITMSDTALIQLSANRVGILANTGS